jgi:hypothetical protein
MQRSHAAAAAFVAIMVLASGAAAQTPPQRPGPVFVNPMGQPFRASPESRRPPVLLWLAHADTDQDQRISRDEFVNEAMAFFANVLDANHDQAITSTESTEYWRAQAPEMLSARTAPVRVAPTGRRENGGVRGARPDIEGQDGGPPSGGRRRGGGEPPRAHEAQRHITLGAELEPVMSCDRDFSRRVDPGEFQTCAARRFFELDVNRDGYFSLYESERAREMLAAYEAQAQR